MDWLFMILGAAGWVAVVWMTIRSVITGEMMLNWQLVRFHQEPKGAA